MPHRPPVWRRHRYRIKRVNSDPTLRGFVHDIEFVVRRMDPLSPLGVNFQRDTMIRERKNGRIDRASVKTGPLETGRFKRRQNPHAAPASGGLFEQDLTPTNHKCMLFDQSHCTRARFPDRQRFRIFCAAEFLHGANATFGLSGNTDKRAEIDECGVVNPGVGFWKKHRRIVPEHFSASDGIDGFAKIQEPCQNASSVSFNDWD